MDQATHNKIVSFIWAVSCLDDEINLRSEYRARLVVDAVTGKLDVREAAA